MSTLQVRELAKHFGAVRALDGVSFEVGEGEFFVILGPTNAGKSTLLKTIAGLYRPDAGGLWLDGRRADGLAPGERNLSLLFQNIALFPDMSGFQNIGFALRVARVDPATTAERVREVARMLKVDHLLDRYPRTYSGGEQQRVAIGRAIALRSGLLMLDEPLSNLDARIRIALRLEFKTLHTELGQTMLYVTHDQVEAMSLSNRIGVLDHGRFHQIGTPQAIYQRPANEFVARFIGTPPMNILEAELTGADGRVRVQGPGYSAAADGFERLHGAQPGSRFGLGVRAEEIAVEPDSSERTPFPADILWVEHLGARRILDLRLGGATVKASVSRGYPGRPGDIAHIGFRAQPHRLLDRETGRFMHQAAG